MVKECIYSPHFDFFIDKTQRNSGYTMPSFHFHKKYEIYYQCDGTREYFIDDAAYPIHPGNLVLIGPDEIHKTSSLENAPHTRIVLNFNAQYIEQVATALDNLPLLDFFEKKQHVLNLSLKSQSIVEGILQKLVKIGSDKLTQMSAVDTAMQKLLLCELLLVLSGCVSEQINSKTGTKKITNSLVEKIKAYISENYKEELTLSTIAAQFYISVHYLSHLFKKITNLSVVEYINSVRILAAKNLLETTKLNINIVAEESGFSTTAHFSRIFKKGTGIPPREYRKMYHD